MSHRDPPHKDRRRSDLRNVPQMVQRWLALMLVVFALATGGIGWWAANSEPRTHFLTKAILYRAIGMELVLTGVLAVVAQQLVSRFLIAPLRRQADYDDLTDLLRPGVFWDRSEIAIELAATSSEDVSFVFLDLDDFKLVNDTYGHAIGDDLLRAFGRVLREHARSSDIVGRLGGEEFGWMMVGAGAEAARQAALRVLAVCRQLTVGPVANFTFSAGVASAVPAEPNVSAPKAWDLARHADLGLYEAKQGGKAQIVIKRLPGDNLRA